MHRTRQTARALSRSPPLISDPLRPDRIAKSQADSKFGKPNFVSFDLWNTLYTPKAPVATQYYQISHGEFGLPKLEESILKEFPLVFSDMEKRFPNYGKYNKEIRSSDDWWLELIVKLYGLPHYSTDKRSTELCVRLLDHFKSSDAYTLYDDVVPVLDELKRKNVRIIASTNSDHRALAILKSLGIAHYFGDRVHLSYDIGHSKPERAFYTSVFNRYYQQDQPSSMSKYLENVWHVGDHYEKDFVGAVKAGWNGILLDRKRKSVFLRTQKKKEISNDCFEGQGADSLDGDDLVMIANNRVCVSGLREVLRLFE